MEARDALNVFLDVLTVLKGTLVALALSVVGWVRAWTPARYLAHKSVSGEVVLVTGAGSGIGRLLARRFARLGAHLVLWDIDQKGNAETERLIRKENGTARAFKVDLSDREGIYRVGDLVKKEMGKVDILINNAGVVTARPFLDCPDPLIERTMSVNAMAHFWTAKCFLPGMMERDHGHMVSLSSAAGLFGSVSLADYCASKFASVGFLESIALELDTRGFQGVCTTTICPYYIDTGMFDGVKTRFSKMMPILDPDYVADKIVSAILTEQRMLFLPKSIYFLYYLRGLLPANAGLYLAHFFGTTHSLDNFQGRSLADKEK